MPIVHSPHSGRPVQVREQDAGRAVRDETGRIFYVLPKADGNGYYGSKTRNSGAAEEQHAAAIAAAGPDSEADAPTPPPHDAAGRKRSTHRGKLLVWMLFIVLAVLGYFFSPYGPYNWKKRHRGATVPSNKIIIGPSPRVEPGADPGKDPGNVPGEVPGARDPRTPDP